MTGKSPQDSNEAPDKHYGDPALSVRMIDQSFINSRGN